MAGTTLHHRKRTWRSVMKPRYEVSSPGEQNREPLWQAVGQVLSDYQKVESILAGLFARLLDGNDSVSLAIFWTAPSLHGRMDLIRNAADGFKASGDKRILQIAKELDHALKLAKRAAEYRNVIAHGRVAKVFKFPGGDLGFWFTGRFRNKEIFMTAEEIIAFMGVCEPAREAVASVLQTMRKMKE
jgi:hypothetical protein